MKGDFSRLIFNPNSNYISVLRQQGRVDLDSDWNEQTEIWTEYHRQLAADLIGPFGVPQGPNDINTDNINALRITDFNQGPAGVFDFKIERGMAYIGGYLYRLHKDVSYRTQIDCPEPENLSDNSDLLVYIEVWRKTVSYIDDELIREPALGGPDTSLRTRLVGQVIAVPISGLQTLQDAVKYLETSLPPSNLQLTLQIEHSGQQIPISFGDIDMGGGMIPGNLHYRLEYHRGLTLNGNPAEGIKWSDENAAVAARILKALASNIIMIEEQEPISAETFKAGDWVEISNSITELKCQGGQIAQLTAVESSDKGTIVTLNNDIHPLLARQKSGGKAGLDKNLAPRIRRWSGYITPLVLKNVYDLGRGVKAIFHCPEKQHHIAPSDYWIYAVRDKEYNKRFTPQKTLPGGIKKYRHPLAIIKRGSENRTAAIIDCRRFIKPLSE